MKKNLIILCVFLSVFLTGCQNKHLKTEAGDENLLLDDTIEIVELDVSNDDLPAPLTGFLVYDEQRAKYANRLPSEYEEGIPDKMLYGVMTDIENLMISHMTYYNTTDKKRDIYTDYKGKRHTQVDFLVTNDAELVFEDGTSASESDLIPDTAVLVQYDCLYETSPGQIHCTKIVILK